MLNSPDQGVNQRKEAILQKSPLLRALLDSRMQSDKTAWETFATEFMRAAAEMRETAQYRGETHDNAPLSATLALSDIFDSSSNHNTRHGALSIVASIGYDIGDIVEAAMFLNDIRRQLIEFKILSPEPEKDAIIRESLMSALATGAERKQRAIEAVPQVFRDFVERLDNSGN